MGTSLIRSTHFSSVSSGSGLLFLMGHLVVTIDVTTCADNDQVLSLHLLVDELLDPFPLIGVDSILEYANGAKFKTLARGVHRASTTESSVEPPPTSMHSKLDSSLQRLFAKLLRIKSASSFPGISSISMPDASATCWMTRSLFSAVRSALVAHGIGPHPARPSTA